jgi:O-antigen/teichoic acid export membrane protein
MSMGYTVLDKGAIAGHASNAAFGILDYLTYPLGMLIVAPIALRTLGIAQYGVWTIATAAVSTGSIIASGFGDANIHFVALSRSSADPSDLVRTVRSTIGIHLVLGFAMMSISILLAPSAAGRVAQSDTTLRFECIWSLFFAGLLMLLRAIESVCISTQRGFERYGHAVRISVFGRVLTLAVAAVLPLAGLSVIWVMAATVLVTIVSLRLQIVYLKKLLRVTSLWPSFDGGATRALFGFGIFTWIQAVAGLLFGQVDRLIAGVSMGAAAVASYALCVQLAQPIYGLAVSGLHFLFPYLSARRSWDMMTLRRTVLLAFGANLLLVSTGTAALLIFGGYLLKTLGGTAVAHVGVPLLPLITWSTALAGLSATGTYALLALGRVRAVTWFNLAGGTLMILLIAVLLPRFGMYGIAVGRMFYGPVTLLAYIPLVAMLFRNPSASEDTPTSIALWEKA